jgi:NTP pyrophosphatase (non-canonical NTP hydrolase)
MEYGFDLADTAENIVKHLRANGFTKEEQPDRQAIALAEEVGEFMQAWRRYRGWARQTGTEYAAQRELADVIITAYVTAAEQNWDIDAVINEKLREIFTRGWRT